MKINYIPSRIILYTNELQSGVPNGDWEEGKDIQEAKEKIVSVLEGLDMDKTSIHTKMTMYKQFNLQSLCTLNKTEFNDMYDQMLIARAHRWVTDTAFNVIIEEAKLRRGSIFVMPEIIEAVEDPLVEV